MLLRRKLKKKEERKKSSIVEIDRESHDCCWVHSRATVCGPVTKGLGVAPTRSLDRSLPGRTGPGTQLSIARSKSQVCYRVHSQDQGLLACL